MLGKDQERCYGTLNFERIDPSDCLESFESNVKFRKTAGYAPVDRILA